jgi:hypothetical protein
MSDAQEEAEAIPRVPGLDAFQRLGSKFERLSQVFDYCLQHPGFEDIVRTIRESPGFGSWSEVNTENSDVGSKQPDGFVYLAKSGKHYKIGRTNSVARRSAEIKIDMPERYVEIHHIQTDDPAGIGPIGIEASHRSVRTESGFC